MAQAAAAVTIPLATVASTDIRKESGLRNSSSVTFSGEAAMATTPTTTSSSRTLLYAKVPSVSRNRLIPGIHTMRANRYAASPELSHRVVSLCLSSSGRPLSNASMMGCCTSYRFEA